MTNHKQGSPPACMTVVQYHAVTRNPEPCNLKHPWNPQAGALNLAANVGATINPRALQQQAMIEKKQKVPLRAPESKPEKLEKDSV